MSSRQELLDKPKAGGHFVQLYDGDERSLIANVGHYLSEGLKHGDGLLVIARPEHTKAFLEQLEVLGDNPNQSLLEGRLILLDARETLARFMVDGQPDWDLFHGAIAAAMERVEARWDCGGLRAYGEMVGILWETGQFSAAIRVEGFWNRLLQSAGFNLFCSYPIDVFGNGFEMRAVDALLCTHTHLLPSGTDGDLGRAIDRAMNEVLGAKVAGFRLLMAGGFQPAWAILPGAEASILWLRRNLPGHAEKILARAREYHRESPTLTARYCAEPCAPANRAV